MSQNDASPLVDQAQAQNESSQLRQLELLAACLQGHTDVVQVLLENGADAEKAATTNGETPIYTASRKGHTDVVRVMLEHGADANKASAHIGLTPLHITSSEGHLDVVRVLLEHGADPDKATTDGQPPLNVATMCERTDVVRLLLEHGADVDTTLSTTRGWWTPLIMASHSGIPDVAKILLEYGADANKGLPLVEACSRGHIDVVRLLINHGVEVNSQVCKDIYKQVGFYHFDHNEAPYLGNVQTLAAPGAQLQFCEDLRENKRNPVYRICLNIDSCDFFRWNLRRGHIAPEKGLGALATSAAMKQLCDDAEKIWSPQRHSLFPGQARRAVHELHRIFWRFRSGGPFWLPLEMWRIICSFAAQRTCERRRDYV